MLLAPRAVPTEKAQLPLAPGDAFWQHRYGLAVRYQTR